MVVLVQRCVYHETTCLSELCSQPLLAEMFLKDLLFNIRRIGTARQLFSSRALRLDGCVWVLCTMDVSPTLC